MKGHLKRRAEDLNGKLERLGFLWKRMETESVKPVECHVCGCRDGSFLTRAGFTYCDRTCMDSHKASIERIMDEVIIPELADVRWKITGKEAIE